MHSAAPAAPLEYAGPSPDVDRAYRYWRRRILVTTIIGYALYYFVRANDAVGAKAMMADLGFTKADVGMISTFGGVMYGVSKFANGLLGDHANPRYFMAIGLALSAVMNICFGFASTLTFLTGFWIANMWFQGMGFPPCAKSMAHWFSPAERSTTFGVWHISHMIGGALISVMTGYLVVWYGWRACYYVPAGIALLGAVYLVLFLRDTPGSMGLPPVEVWKGEETPEQLARETHQTVPAALADGPTEVGPPMQQGYWSLVVEFVLTNPFMWVISLANLCVYTLRWVQMKWGPTFLQEVKHIDVVGSGWLAFGSEFAGMISALLAGLAADRYFGGKGGRVCVIAMALMTVAIAGFWWIPSDNRVAGIVLFLLMGFLIYIPQMLIAAVAMNLGTKRASAAAVGMTGIIGYLGTVLGGWGVGKMADNWGWGGPFAMMIACAALTAVLMLFTWNVGPHREPAR